MALVLLFWSWDAISFINRPKEYAVVRVIDGDGAIVLSRNNNRSEIRLADIDAPEIGQQYGQFSKQTLKTLIDKKIVTLRHTGKKTYGRDVVRLYLKGQDINRRMVRIGAAWVEPRFARDKSYYEAQKKARKQRIGLWHKKNPMPPWVWRRLFKGYK